MSEEKTLEQLQEELQNLKAEIELLTEGYEQLKAENELLKTQLSSAGAEKAKGGAGTVVELDGVQYEILAPSIRVPKFGKLSAAELAEKPEALQALVKSQSSLLREVK